MNEPAGFQTNFSKQAMQEIKNNLPTTTNYPPSINPRFQLSNPFDTQQYGQINLPDTPLQMSGGMMEALLGNKEVPPDIMKAFWYVFLNDTSLSFVDQDRKIGSMLNFDIIKIDVLNSMPYYDYTFDAEMKWNILRNVYETKLNRAFGFKSGGKPLNERIILQSQFLEQRNINESTDNSTRDGFFRRLLGRKT